MTELSSWESVVILEILPSFLPMGILATGHVLPFLGLLFLGLLTLSRFDLLKKKLWKHVSPVGPGG